MNSIQQTTSTGRSARTGGLAREIFYNHSANGILPEFPPHGFARGEKICPFFNSPEVGRRVQDKSEKLENSPFSRLIDADNRPR